MKGMTPPRFDELYGQFVRRLDAEEKGNTMTARVIRRKHPSGAVVAALKPPRVQCHDCGIALNGEQWKEHTIPVCRACASVYQILDTMT